MKKAKSHASEKEKPPGKKRSLCKPLSLSEFTFNEIVDVALNTKPKKLKDEVEPKTSEE